MNSRGGYQKRVKEFLSSESLDDDNNKAKFHNTQPNSKCWLCGDRDETINHMIIECSKLGGKSSPEGIVQEIKI